MTDGTQPKSSQLYLVLLVLGSLLLAGIVVVIVLLLTSPDRQLASGGTPTPTSTTPATATPTPTAADPDTTQQQSQQSQPADAKFTVFTPTTEVSCVQNSSEPNPTADLTWDSQGAVTAWMWINLPDAYGSFQVPVRGSTADMVDGGQFPCNGPSKVQYVLTLVGADGKHVNKTWVVTNVGEQAD